MKKNDFTIKERNKRRLQAYNLAAQAAGFKSLSAMLTALKNAYLSNQYFKIEMNNGENNGKK